MFRKLLKYDLKFTFKYWWILAVTSVVMSFIGGACIRFFIEYISSDSEPTAGLTFFALIAFIGIILTIITLCAFLLVAEILIYIRFYKNLFSDEGYLTFTLPVKRSALLNSKLAMSMINSACTTLVLLLDITILVAFAMGPDFFSLEPWRALLQFFFGDLAEFFNMGGARIAIFLILSVIMLLVIAVIVEVSSNLVIFACITFAAMITKKNKILAAIGIYYAVNMVTSFVLQFGFSFGIMSLSEWVYVIGDSKALLYAPDAIILMAMLIALTIAAGIAIILYTLQLWLMDKKLNLT